MHGGDGGSHLKPSPSVWNTHADTLVSVLHSVSVTLGLAQGLKIPSQGSWRNLKNENPPITLLINLANVQDFGTPRVYFLRSTYLFSKIVQTRYQERLLDGVFFHVPLGSLS